MRRTGNLLWGLTLALALGAGAASASTFARVGLDYLAAQNSLIVVGEALSARSYWNDPGTLILTDVQVSVSEVLKGKLAEPEITVTLPGGKVGDDTVAVLGGAELVPGNFYVLFLRKGDLPGAQGVLVVREHSQGVFELQLGKDDLQAVSQAVRMNLIPDAFGNATTPGGGPGMPLEVMRQSIRTQVERTAAPKEEKP